MIVRSSEFVWTWGARLQAAGGFIAPVVGFLHETKEELKDVPTPIGFVISLVTDHALKFYIFAGVLLVLGWGVRRFCYDPWVVKQIQAALDDLQAESFKKLPNARKHLHRVTLFKFRKFYWPKQFSEISGKWVRWPRAGAAHPYSGWLVPFMRSWHTSKKTATVFLAPDDAKKAQGLVGEAWSCRAVVHVHEVNEPSLADVQSIEDYAKKTGCSVGWVKARLVQNQHFAQSFGAIPIEQNGTLWGVLILDSAQPKAVSAATVNNQAAAIGMISRLLEKLR